MRGQLHLDTMHVDRVNLIMWYLSIRRFDLETRHIVVTVKILRSFLWYATNKLMHVMKSWFLGYIQSFSLIKSWVQNWVSIDTKIMAFLIFGKQFLVIWWLKTSHTHTHIYLIENIIKMLIVNTYIFQEPRVIFFLGFDAFASTGKVLLMSLCLESSRWLRVGL